MFIESTKGEDYLSRRFANDSGIHPFEDPVILKTTERRARQAFNSIHDALCKAINLCGLIRLY